MKKIYYLFVALFLFMSISFSAVAQESDSAFVINNYEKKECQITMRDGKKLFTIVYSPKDKTKKYPFLLNRTPYSIGPYGEGKYKLTLGPSPFALREGFIFVYQDVRGKFMSEGEYENIRPQLTTKSKTAIDESTDTYDTVDWLVKNVANNNGKIGVYGISYPGFYSTTAALSGHPAIKAVSPQAPVTNWFLGDDFHHNGAFFMMDAFAFYSSFGLPRPIPVTEWPRGYQMKSSDAYNFYLSKGALKNIEAEMFKGNVAFYKDMVAHPDYDSFWKARDIRQFMKDIKPAMLVVGGFFDAEDCWGALETYKTIEKNNPKTTNTLVMGPWFHGGWMRSDGSYFGDIKFGSATSIWYQQNVELPFFVYHLKGVGSPDIPEALTFDIGADKWQKFAAWPPVESKQKTLYFQSNGKLAFDAPTTANGSDEYISDPSKPVPYQDGVGIKRTREYMIDDQRFASRRPDVLVYETNVLEKDITLAGPLNADLFISTTGTDGDFIVKVIDVYPDSLKSYQLNNKEVLIGGYQMLVRGEVMRARYRNSYEKPEALTPGKTEQVKFYLPDVMHTFKKGHKIMVQVQSTWFPLVDRNPQKFVENIYQANDDDFQKATIRVMHQNNASSGLHITVIE
ncbi:CocE/NonD family hydrolase [Solitalea canadensis]|uniref:Putative hydrolase, CocE/NonD family n=1 Tax=Solitalea canadensis (strain ATCC 29591 / DSM 3403 / JCM 21819 / LMG 8368 / NBRC 15130 / NCIMB 12057 / USAM 9D) TaxID=929556 RepID=H8KMG4_SOLCM|nr:CocE/NonD family hydrolase [Solitalea canadensis]AFD08759.1 putative hydrolase, CocE/NonD family [Solitalea canadensis DSM 3403]